MSFQSLQLIDPILKSLQEQGYNEPTPIQQQAIPIVLDGNDVMGCAQTGTGKTAAFAIPILQLMSAEKRGSTPRIIRALVLTPTRELALQIQESFATYGKYTTVRTAVVFGGVNQYAQVMQIRKGIDILVATPGRLLDLIDQKIISLKDIRYFVLDEADRMLDMGFIPDIKKVVAMLPEKRQTLFFSATMPPEIATLANRILNDPLRIEVNPPASTVELTKQYLYWVDKKDKSALLLQVLKKKTDQTVLVFTRTKHGADKVVKVLNRNNIRAEAIHGNKSQNARQNALSNFKSQKTRVLVATDIASRGIDVDDLGLVINFEIPNIPETYVHRIGRTGRAGANGVAISFCDKEERNYMRDIEKLIRKRIAVLDTPEFEAVAVPVQKEREFSTVPRKESHSRGPRKDSHSSGRSRRRTPFGE